MLSYIVDGDIKVMEVLLSVVAVEVEITAGHMLKHKAAMSNDDGSVCPYQQSRNPQGVLGCSKLQNLRPRPQFGNSYSVPAAENKQQITICRNGIN